MVGGANEVHAKLTPPTGKLINLLSSPLTKEKRREELLPLFKGQSIIAKQNCF